MRLTTRLDAGADYSSRPGAARVTRNLIRDATLLGLDNIVRYLDPEDRNLNIGLKTGRSIVNAADGLLSWTSSGITAAPNANFGGRTVLNFPTPDADVRFQAGGLKTAFSFLVAFSIPQSVLTALSNSNINRFLAGCYDPVINNFGWSAYLFSANGGATRGFSFNPYQSGGGGGNNTSSAVIPVADKATLLGVRFAGTTSRIYVNDLTTPVSTKTNHTAAPPVEATRQLWPGSVFAGTTSGWVGGLGPMLLLDDTDATKGATDAQWAQIGADWRSYYGITL